MAVFGQNIPGPNHFKLCNLLTLVYTIVIVHCYSPSVKASQIKVKRILKRKVCFTSSNLTMTSQKQQITYCGQKLKAQFSPRAANRWVKNFARVARTCTIKQNHLGLQPWISMPFSKPQTYLRRIALEQYQCWSGTQIPV